MAELVISEEMLIRRCGSSTTKLATLARRAVDWVEKHGDAQTLASAIMVLLREDVVMNAMFGDDGIGGRVMARRAMNRPYNGKRQAEATPTGRKKSAGSSAR